MTSPNMGLTEPTDHGSTSTWGAILNAAFDLLDAHDHTSGKGVPVPAAALKIDNDVSWSFGGTKYAITSAKAFGMSQTPAASVASYTNALFVDSADGNLKFRNGSGTNVQITAGSTINVSLVGGIGGDYAAVSALESYDDATRRYLLQQEVSAGLRAWAGLATADIDLYQKAVSISNKVTLKSPSALAASYALTFPGALPGAAALVQTDTSGNLSFSNTTTQTITAGTLKFTAQSERTTPATQYRQTAASHTAHVSTAGGIDFWTLNASSDTLVIPVPMNTGEQLMGYKLYLNKSTTGATTITVKMVQLDGTTGTEIVLDTSTNNLNNPTFTAIEKTSGLLSTAAKGQSYYAVVSLAGGGSGDHVFHLAAYITKS